jgi:CRISPR-associated protein Cas2
MRKSGPMFVVVAYDVQDDGRRRRVHKTLKNFGRPVQYSAFECVLDSTHLYRLRQALSRLLQGEKEEAVAYYFLCQECARKTLVLCGPPRVTLSRTVVV